MKLDARDRTVAEGTHAFDEAGREAVCMTEFTSCVNGAERCSGSRWLRQRGERELERYGIALAHWNERRSTQHYGGLPRRLKPHWTGVSIGDKFEFLGSDSVFGRAVVKPTCNDGCHRIQPGIEREESLTRRAAAPLRTFPDDYCFEAVGERRSRSHAFGQVEDAVPVLRSRRMAAGYEE